MANRYLNNKDLLKEIMLSKKNDKLTDNNVNMFILLVDRIGRKFYYKNNQDKEDCRQTALLHLFSNWRNFDITKSSNAFAYYTEIVKRGYASGWVELIKQKGNSGDKIQHFSLNSNMDGESMNF